MKMSSSSGIYETIYHNGSNLLRSFCCKLRRGKMTNNLTELIRPMDESLMYVFKFSEESKKMFVEEVEYLPVHKTFLEA